MATKSRTFAFIVYPESAPTLWIDNLKAQHIRCAVSPLHDKDIHEKDNPKTGAKKGDPKKPHYHVLLDFDSVKSLSQVADIYQKVLELSEKPDNAVIEMVKSTNGYYRYLTHKDDPDKAQYKDDAILHLCGCSPDDFVTDKDLDWKILKEIIRFCSENGITSYCTLVDICATTNFEWFKCVCGRFSYVINSYLKSLGAE